MEDQNNKLIADFIGLERNDQGYLNDHNSMGYLTGFPSWDYGRLPLEQLRFDVDWNWLMYVVSKIEDLGIGKRDYTVRISYDICSIDYTNYNKRSDTPIVFKRCVNQKDKFEAVYEAVIEFIKWYNTEKQ